MSVKYCESFITFELPDGSRLIDEIDRNETNADFQVQSDPEMWLEVKNWDAPTIPERERPIVKQDLLDRTSVTSDFWSKIARKFERTASILNRTDLKTEGVILALLLESEDLNHRPFAPMVRVLQREIAKLPLISDQPIVVFRMRDAATLFPEINVWKCQVTKEVRHACVESLHNCTILRQQHQQ